MFPRGLGHQTVLVQRQFEVKLGDLMVHDEHHLVVKRRLRTLQTQQGVEVDQVPIGPVVGVQQSIEVAAEVLAHRCVLLLQLLEFLQDGLVK